MQDKKIANRENYKKSKTHENRNKHFAYKQISLRNYEELKRMEKNIIETCTCIKDEIPAGKQH